MAKCCCAPEISASQNRILAAIASRESVVPAAIPPFQRTQNDAEFIARRVADELNRNPDPFQRDTQVQLDAITNALIAIRSQLNDESKLNQILRNQNDAREAAREYQRQTQFGLDQLATRAQAKDLLLAIASFRRDMLEQFRFSAREIAFRFSAVGGAIAALGIAQAAAFKAEIAAKIAQTATILRAIAALRLNPPQSPANPAILELLSQLLESRLELEAVTTSIPACVPSLGGGFTIQAIPVPSFALSDGQGRSTVAYQQSISEMLFSLLVDGQIECGGGSELEAEVIAEIDGSLPSSDIPLLLSARDVTPRFFTIEVTEVNPAFVRTYKLAGDLSEYGLGNWGICDSAGRMQGEFQRLFIKSHRLAAPSDLAFPQVRVSLKPGISAIITAIGTPNR